MAEGRMLKKQISRSRRLGELKSDSARLLYTWIIPHLDIKGRHEADPNVIKGEIVPRIESFTSKNIQAYLEDMHRVGLITLYKCDGDQFLQFRKFEEHQSLRPDKEACSRIPEPDNSGTTPVQLPDKDDTTPAEVKISKEKISKEKPPISPNGDFELFWESYPRKDSKGSAEKAWMKLKPKKDLVEKILLSLEAHKKSEQWKKDHGSFIPYAQKFLNNKYYEDEVKEALTSWEVLSRKSGEWRKPE